MFQAEHTDMRPRMMSIILNGNSVQVKCPSTDALSQRFKGARMRKG